MLKIIKAVNQNEWDTCVKAYENWDIYYLNAYACSFQIHGDGEPLLIEFSGDDSKFCYVLMMSDIADCPFFQGKLEPGNYYDLETPYGYGGPLSSGPVSEKDKDLFSFELKNFCNDNGIVSQFIRFHPLLNNQSLIPEVLETKYMRDTICIDTSDRQTILNNMDSKNRNMVRKAVKNKVHIITRPIDDFDDFVDMYNATMQRDNADPYYIFDKSYFEFQKKLDSNALIFYAMLDDKPIAGSVMYYNGKYMHYHLSGSYSEFRYLAPTNLLLFEAACWASDSGIHQLHLGGGLSSDDNLFGFKKQFNKNGRLPFCVGRTVFDRQGYNYLLELRRILDKTFDMNNSRMIQYRCP